MMMMWVLLCFMIWCIMWVNCLGEIFVGFIEWMVICLVLVLSGMDMFSDCMCVIMVCCDLLMVNM